MARVSAGSAGSGGADAGAPPPSADGDGEGRMLRRMLIAAAAFAVVLIGSMVAAAELGWLPIGVLSMNADVALPPSTTNPETTALGAEPIYASRCGYTAQAPGAQCAFYVADSSGDLVAAGLTVSVPSAWLARQAHPTRKDAMAVVAALIRSPYGPVGGQGLRTLSFSVDPVFAAKLRTVHVTPQTFMAWVYRDVPPAQRPPWAVNAGGAAGGGP